jgi:outer membrane protein TolC
VRETEAQIVVDVNKQFRKVQETAAALRVSQLAMDAAAEKLRITGDEYRVQAVRLAKVFEVQADLAAAASQHQKSLSEYWTAKADLAKAMGEE